MNQAEVERLWPLSRNFEYASEVGLAMRSRLPGLWSEWRGKDYGQLPQAEAFQFLLFCEETYPEETRALVPGIISSAPEKLQQEWKASLMSPQRAASPEEESLPAPSGSPPIFSHPSLWEYSDRTSAIHRWTNEALPARKVRSADPAEESDLLRVHEGSYLRGLQEMEQRGGGPLSPETMVVPGSWQSILLSSGAVFGAAEEALESGLAFAEVAPGSHHAGRSRACGTCLVNNIAVAAERARRRRDVGRVAVLDIDAHHGNGTEEIFWERADTLTVSIHQEPPFFPGTGSPLRRGRGEGTGQNHNIAVREQWLEGVLLGVELVHDFSPDLLLVQFGGDAHWADSASDLLASGEDFQIAGQRLRETGLPIAVELGSSTSQVAWREALRGFTRGILGEA